MSIEIVLTGKFTVGDVETMNKAIETSDQDGLLAIQLQIEEGLKNKKNQANAITLVENITFNSENAHSIMLHVFDDIMNASHEAKTQKQIIKFLKSYNKSLAETQNKGMLRCIFPKLINHVEKPLQNKWKIKAVALDLLNDSLLKDCSTIIPKQLEHCYLVRMVKLLCAGCKEIRAEIKNPSTDLLKTVGTLVRCGEIRAISEKLINCLCNFGNTKLATETLYLVANTTFLSYVDAASFALLFPIVERAMKERQQDSNKNGLMITGASVTLIEDPEVLQSYIPQMLPLLKDLCVNPSFEIQREAAKAIAALSKNLPHLLIDDIKPWLLLKVQSAGDLHQSAVERSGAAHSISEICKSVPTFLGPLLIEIKSLLADGPVAARAGAQNILEFLAKVDGCVPHLEQMFIWILKGLNDDNRLVSEQALLAGKNLVGEWGGLKSSELISPLTDAILTFSGSAGDEDSARSRAIALFRQLVEKVSEMKRYGQDMTNMECCTEECRSAMLVMLLISRNDSDANVRRVSNKLLGENVQSISKCKQALIPILLSSCKYILTHTNEIKKQSVILTLKNMTEAKEFNYTPETLLNDASVNEKLSVIKDTNWDNCKLGNIKAKTVKEDNDNNDEEDNGWLALEERSIKKVENLTSYEQTVVIGCTLESRDINAALESTKKFLKKDIKLLLEDIFKYYVCKDAIIEKPEEVICRIENLMLMYGGGHMLLKDTLFELRKGKRYGVVGRNGCGKTTLMNLLAKGNKAIAQLPPDMTCIHVKPEVLDNFMATTCKKFMEIENPVVVAEEGIESLENILRKVNFPEELWEATIAELSGGWRMKLLIAAAMMKKADVLLLDEPTNHLDAKSVQWLCDYLNGLTDSAIMVISHDPTFLNRVCTNIINYNKGKLVYYEGNFDIFISKLNIKGADAANLLAGNIGVAEDGTIERDTDKKEDEETTTPEESEEQKSEEKSEEKTEEVEKAPAAAPAPAAEVDRKAKIVFPVPGKVKGVNSLAKAVLECKDLTYGYTAEKGDVIQGVSAKITMNSRVHIKGVNGAGKTTFMNLLCGEVHPNASACPQKGTVDRHRNCRLSYMAQQHMHHMAPFMNSSPYIYLQKRFANGCDGALQERLLIPQSEEEAEDRIERAKIHGKYNCQIENLVGRQMRGKDIMYEIKWVGLDTKQNTWANMSKLQDLGCEGFALAYDDRMAAQEAGLHERPLSQREIVKHLAQFGIDEELALNRTIGMFSAGQKSKVSLAAAFWSKPHVIALDEPTNYIDMETLDSLVVALQRFKGGVICISHCADFSARVCNETWFLEGGGLTVTKEAKK